MFERFTEKARRAVFFSRYHASQSGSPYIESEHLLLGLMHEDRAMFSPIGGVPIESFSKYLEDQTPAREKIPASNDLPLSDAFKGALAFGAEEADGLGHRNIDTCHLLLGLMRIETCKAVVFLKQHGIEYAGYREKVRESPPETSAGGRSTPTRPEPEPVNAAAPSLAPPITVLKRLLAAAEPLRSYSEKDAGHRLKRRPWSRKQALGHMLNMAAAHHLLLARALTESSVTAGMYPLEDWVTAQHYDEYLWSDLVDAWISINQLLAHMLALVPENRVSTVIRVGIENPQTLLQLIARYAAESEDLMGQVLSHL